MTTGNEINKQSHGFALKFLTFEWEAEDAETPVPYPASVVHCTVQTGVLDVRSAGSISASYP